MLGCSACASSIPHRDGSATFFIVSTSESRAGKDECLFLTDRTRGCKRRCRNSESETGALRAWAFDRDSRSKFHLFPVAGKNDTFHIVGTSESRKSGFMAWLDSDGTTDCSPFDPSAPNLMAQWRFVPSSLSVDGPSFFIVATVDSKWQPGADYSWGRAMLNLKDPEYGDGGRVEWSFFDERDVRALWRVLPAPPSPVCYRRSNSDP